MLINHTQKVNFLTDFKCIILTFHANTKAMKKIFIYLTFAFVFSSCVLCFKPHETQNTSAFSQKPKMCIVIDDFGSYEQAGVETILSIADPITCAVLPNVDNTKNNLDALSKTGHEIILHMPMESHVYLPENWYGPVFIKNSDSPEIAYKKLDECLKTFPNIKGFNIHIGSGVSQNKSLMTAIYTYAKEHNLYFLDSRTIETKACEDACKNTQSVYLGRDVFLEPNKNRSYHGVQARLFEGANIAKEKGYSIVIGHVGAEGGENTAKAIKDSLPKIKEQGIQIVSLSEIFEELKTK